MASDSTRRITIEVDVSGGQTSLRQIKDIGEATDKLNNSQDHNIRVQKDLVNANVNASKKFADQQQTMSGLVRTYAITAANVFALSAAYNVLRENANLEIMVKASEQLSRSTGINFSNVGKSLRDISQGALGVKESVQAATLGISGGASIEQLKAITTVATKAATALGRSVPDSISRMVQAVTKGEPELVDEFGIILRLTVATDEYARSVGKAASELNTMEKQQAIVQQLIKQGETKFKDITIEDNVNQFDRLATTVKAVTQTILTLVSGPIASLFSILSDHSGLLNLVLLSIASSITKTVIPSFREMGKSFSVSSTEAVIKAKAAQVELGTFYEATTAKINSQRNSVLGTTLAYKDAQSVLRANLPSVKAVSSNIINPGRTFNFVENNINIKDIERQLAEVSNVSTKINVKVADTVQKISQESARAIIKTMSETRLLAEAEVGKTFKGITIKMQEGINFLGQGIHGAIGGAAALGGRVSQVVGAAFSGETAAGGILEIQRVKKEQLEIAQHAKDAAEDAGKVTTALGQKWAKASNIIVSSAGVAATSIRLIGTAINFVLPIIGILTTLYVVGSEIIDWMDLIPESSKKASAKLDELNDGFNELQTSVADATLRLQQNASTMDELVSKYTLLGNKTRDVNTKIAEGLAILKDVGGGAFQNTIGMRLLGIDGGTKQVNTLKSIVAHVKELEKVTGKPIDLIVNVKGKEIDLRGNLDKLTGLTPEAQLIIEQKVRAETEKRNREVIDTEGSVKDLNSAVIALNKAWVDQTTQFRRANPLSIQIDSMETLIRTYKKFTIEGKAVEAELAIINGLDPGKAKSIGLDTSKIDQLTTINEVNNTIKKMKESAQTPATRFQLYTQMLDDGKLILKDLNEIPKALKAIYAAGKVGPELLKSLEASVAKDTIALGQSGNLAIEEAANKRAIEQLNQELTLQNKLAELTAKERVQTDKGAKGDTEELIKSLKTKREILETEKEAAQLAITSKESTIKGLTDPSAITQQRSEIDRLKESIKELTYQQNNYSDAVLASTAIIASYKQKLEPVKQDIERLNTFITELETQQKARPETKDKEGLDNIRALNEEINNQTSYKLNLEKLILKEEQNIADATKNKAAFEASSLSLVKLEGEEKKEQAKTIQNTINLLKEQLALREIPVTDARTAADKAEKATGLLSSISSNDKFDPTFRAKALILENAKAKETLDLKVQELDALVKYNNELTKEEKSLLGAVEVKKLAAELDNKKLETESLFVAYSIQKLDNAKKQNEIDKLLVDKGLKDFNTTFKQSMAIAANDFSKSLGTSVDRVVKRVIDTLDATLDTTFSNAEAFLTGAKTGKEAIAGIQEDLSKFFINSAVSEAKNNLKEAFLGLFSGRAGQFATPQEETNDWLKQIYNVLAGTSGASAFDKLGTQPGSSQGIGGSLFTGIKDFFGKAGSVLSDTAGTISNFFSDLPGYATGGVVSSPTYASVAENGAEAVIPLAGGAVPVQLSGGGSIEATKTLIAVSQKMRDIVGNGDEQIAVLQGTNIAINTMSNAIVNQLIIGTSQIVNSLTGVSSKTGWNSIASGLIAISSLVGAASSAYGSASSAGSSSDTAVASDYGSFSGGTSDAAYADGGIVDRPTRALIGEGRNSEAVVPLPNNRSIPVQFQGKQGMSSDHPINISVNILGVRDEGGLNRSANQIALEFARAAQRALRRDG